MKDQSGRRSFSRNVLINAGFPIAPVLVATVTVPLYLKVIGLERYGILSFVWLVSGLFSLVELGLGQVTNYKVARAMSEPGDAGREAHDVVLTALAFSAALGCLAGVAFWLVAGPLIFHPIKVSREVALEVDQSLFYIALLLPLTLMLAVLRGAAEGRSDFISSNTIQTGGQIVAMTSTLGVAYFVGPELPALVCTVVLARFGVVAAFLWLDRAVLKSGRLMGFRETFDMLRFGGWSSLFTSVSLLATSLDRFVIGWMAGAAATTYYTVPYGVVQRTQFIREALLRTLFPKLSRTTDPLVRRTLIVRMLKATLCATGAIGVTVLVAIDELLAVWINRDFSVDAGAVTKVLIVAFWFVTALRTMFIFEISSGRPEGPARLRLVTVAPFALLLVAMVHFYGPLGAGVSLLCWWGFEFVFMLTRHEMLGELSGVLLGWGLLWSVAVTASITPLPLTGRLASVVAVGAAACVLAVMQSQDIRRIAEGLTRSRAARCEAGTS